MMGTDIQANTCLPQHHSMMDLDGNTSNGMNHLFVSLQSTNGYLGYEMKKVRQTILKHESIFRYQLQELHRLYKRQRDLMNEIKSKGRDTDHTEAEKSYSSPLFSPVPPQNAKRTWDVSHSSLLHSMIGQLSTSGPSIRQSPYGFVKGDPGNVTCLVRADISGNTSSGFHLSSKYFFHGSFDGKNAGSSLGNLQYMSEMNGKSPPVDSNAEKRANYHSSTGSFCSGISPTSFRSVLGEPRSGFPTYCALDDHKSAARRKSTIFGVEISEGNEDRAASNVSNQMDGTLLINSESFYTPLLTKNCHTLGKKAGPFKDYHCIVTSKPTCWIANSSVQHTEFSAGNANGKWIDDCPNGFNFFRLPNQCTESDCVKSFQGSDGTSLKPQELVKTDSEYSEKLQKEVIPQHNPVLADCQIKQKIPEGGLPWFLRKPQNCGEQTKERKNSYFMNLDSLQNNSHQFFKRAKVADCSSQTLHKKHDTSSPMAVWDAEGRIIEVWDPSKSSSSDVESDGARKLTKDKALSINQLETEDFALQKGLDNYISGLKHHIDLNLSLDEEEAPLAPSLPTAIVKIAITEIDLEAPAIIDSDADSSPKRAEIGKSDGHHEEDARVAAQAIVAISSSGKKNLVDDGTYGPAEAASGDHLTWFAEIICARFDDNKIADGEATRDQPAVCDEEFIPDCMDYFEFMTLQLKETKEDYYCKPIILDNENHGATGTFALSKRNPRGQVRRRRQQKDFQRDVLPGLVTLSRLEVTEDIQTFEEVLKARGCHGQSSLSLRNAAKNVRGRKRSGGPGTSPTKKAVRSTSTRTEKLICPELSLEKRNLTGWGKRTKRLPRQRCPNRPSITETSGTS